MGEQEETVAAAAVLVKGVIWTLPRPAHHSHILRACMDVNRGAIGLHKQGFVTSTGRFVNRFEAAALVGREGPLYAEDLW